MFVFVKVIVIVIISPAKHADWEGVTTTRIGESASWDMVDFKRFTQASVKYKQLVRAERIRVEPQKSGGESVSDEVKVQVRSRSQIRRVETLSASAPSVCS